jgi:predicted ArsR family transcriptional regulator
MTDKTPTPELKTPGLAKLPTANRPAQLRKLLVRRSGATIPQIQQSFDWQPHTVRAAISKLRKAGDVVDRTETSKGSVYRISPTSAAP